MFPFDSDDLPAFHREGASAVQMLGSLPARVARYRELSAAGKIDHAALQYRVFSRRSRGRVEIVAEYWCYYVYNAFTVRGAWFPYRVPDNHSHDLERIYMVLTANKAAGHGLADGTDEAWARAAFRIERVITNAHDGSIPPNQYDVRSDERLTPPLTVLVERGSHAMAADIDRDGRFTPGIDSTATTKLLWGIRDRGTTWGRYRASYMDFRDASSVRLCGPSTEPAGGEPCPSYKLYPVTELQQWFSTIRFTGNDRRRVVGRTPFMIRTFGDVRVEKLMVPSDPADGGVLDQMLHRRANPESGMLVGFTTVGARMPTVLVGRRYFRALESRFAPDFVAEAVALFPTDQRRRFEGTVSGSYSVDAITNVFVGVGWFSDAQEVVDLQLGLDLRIGRMRARPTWRFREGVFDYRITTTF